MASKYWVANNPNSEINDTKAQKLAELSATSVSLAELNALDADSTQCTITPAGGAGFILKVQTANQSGLAVTDAAGLCELDLTEAGLDVIYLAVSQPDGRVAVSAACTWLA